MSAEPAMPHEGGAPSHHRASYVFLAVNTVLWAAADLVSKGWAKGTLSGFDPDTLTVRKHVLVPDHLQFIFAQNPGGAWSFLRNLPEVLRRPFFMFISAAAIVFIVSVYSRIHADQRSLKWGLPLALGGAIGNLVDRIRYGWVVDFIDMFVVRGGREYHWPTFNIADVAIVLGVGLMALDLMLHARHVVGHDVAPRPDPAG